MSVIFSKDAAPWNRLITPEYGTISHAHTHKTHLEPTTVTRSNINVDQTKVYILDGNFQSRIFPFATRFGSEDQFNCFTWLKPPGVSKGEEIVSSYLAKRCICPLVVAVEAWIFRQQKSEVQSRCWPWVPTFRGNILIPSSVLNVVAVYHSETLASIHTSTRLNFFKHLLFLRRVLYFPHFPPSPLSPRFDCLFNIFDVGNVPLLLKFNKLCGNCA